MKFFTLLITAAVLTGCATASPTQTMSEDQISKLSDRQICNIRVNHLFETKLELEIGKRGLECSEEYHFCKERGLTQATPEFQNCKSNEELKTKASTAIGNALRAYR